MDRIVAWKDEKGLVERVTMHKGPARIAYNFIPVVPKQPAKANILVKDVKLNYWIKHNIVLYTLEHTLTTTTTHVHSLSLFLCSFLSLSSKGTPHSSRNNYVEFRIV